MNTYPFLNRDWFSSSAKSLQSCPTLCDPIDGSPPGSPIPGILQARTLVGWHFLLQCMKLKSESEVVQSCPTLATPWTAAYQAPPSIGFSRQEYWSGCHFLSLLWSVNIYVPFIYLCVVDVKYKADKFKELINAHNLSWNNKVLILCLYSFLINKLPNCDLITVFQLSVYISS